MCKEEAVCAFQQLRRPEPSVVGELQTGVLIRSKRDYGVNFGRAPRWEVACYECDAEQQ